MVETKSYRLAVYEQGDRGAEQLEVLTAFPGVTKGIDDFFCKITVGEILVLG